MTPDPCADFAAWGAVEALLPKLGITRLADVTGLDVLGLPVVQAIRPYSKSNSVSQGKGMNLYKAAQSAVMESAEGFFAERLELLPVTVGCAKALGIPAGLYDLHVDQKVRDAWVDWDTAWTPAANLSDGSAALVPLELVHTAYIVPPADYDGLFRTSTTGLAVSVSPDAATRHGLLECIERDAVARALRTHGALQRFRFDPACLRSPELDYILSLIGSKGFVAGFWLLPAIGQCPVVWCHLMEDCDAASAVLPRPAEGSAARLTVAEASIAAVLEAAQSRLTVIAGARDDIGRESYRSTRDSDKRAAHRALLKDGRAMVASEEMKDLASGSAADDVNLLLSLLKHDGIEEVYTVTIETSPVSHLHARKVVVPGLLPLDEG